MTSDDDGSAFVRGLFAHQVKIAGIADRGRALFVELAQLVGHKDARAIWHSLPAGAEKALDEARKGRPAAKPAADQLLLIAYHQLRALRPDLTGGALRREAIKAVRKYAPQSVPKASTDGALDKHLRRLLKPDK